VTNRFTLHLLVGLGVLILVTSLPLVAQSRGKAGDEEGEYYGGKWPEDIPKETPVKYYLPFQAGKRYRIMPAPGHTAPQNKYAIDFATPMGTPVLASADGWVMKAIESGPDGGGRTNSLIIVHADGDVTCYLHLKHKGVIPRLGDFVFRGDVVAYSGNSGGGPPHLHFSVNKMQGLECIPAKFVEGSPSSASKNKSFEQRYGPAIAKFHRGKVALGLGREVGFWKAALQARKELKSLKPKKTDHIKFKKLYKELEELVSGLDEQIKGWVESVQSAEPADAYRLAGAGVEELRGTDHEASLKEVLKGLESREDYKELKKEARTFERMRRELKRTFESDLKGSSPRRSSSAYRSWLKRYGDAPAGWRKAVEKRAAALQAMGGG
jgi:murein DD-endopeptidase MepM/ murein hydrolase activator NlpD